MSDGKWYAEGVVGLAVEGRGEKVSGEFAEDPPSSSQAAALPRGDRSPLHR